MKRTRILVAVLNWGLGHATRCIPIIKALEKNNFEVFIASNGDALRLLKTEFKHLESITLPAYNIFYSRKPQFLKWKLLAQSPHILKTISKEKKLVEELVQKYKFNGIISDNRWGCRHPDVKSVFITHQHRVLSGNTTYFSSKIQQKYIAKFDECWIPDIPGKRNLSGIMGHSTTTADNVKYIGVLSRFQNKTLEIKYDLAVILSGPEPQRTLLENALLKNLKKCDKKIILVRGKINGDILVAENKQIQVENYLNSMALEKVILQSDIIICRSGYSSLMDLTKLEKKAFLIPTPGQFEQEYLAKRCRELGIAPYCQQKDFKYAKLKELANYSGFQDLKSEVDFSSHLALFKRK
ncbi:Predicted glycosyl transferase [Salegentibacter echinorum]|uniref:Predicted glycosyl transferase n=1 Tax=Salegentibacter echinorum TaxID=1073325 RepID=A0A1M5HNF7_SALEC|nr:glycosyltransferase [Salegentibacter echinorum]SHG17494.1 Predicted glycosyl transferase [Salegentibacter echinorum]